MTRFLRFIALLTLLVSALYALAVTLGMAVRRRRAGLRVKPFGA